MCLGSVCSSRTPALEIRSWTAAFQHGCCSCRVHLAQRRQEVNPGVPRARQKRVKLLRLRQSLVVQAAIGRHMQVIQAAGAALSPLFPPSRHSLIFLTSWPDRSLLLFGNLLYQIRSAAPHVAACYTSSASLPPSLAADSCSCAADLLVTPKPCRRHFAFCLAFATEHAPSYLAPTRFLG